MQLPAEKAPDALEVKLTLPVGVSGVPVSVSVTVAVQAVGAFTGIGLEVHTTLVEVVRLVAVRLKSLLLARWSVSPP